MSIPVPNARVTELYKQDKTSELSFCQHAVVKQFLTDISSRFDSIELGFKSLLYDKSEVDCETTMEESLLGIAATYCEALFETAEPNYYWSVSRSNSSGCWYFSATARKPA